VASGGHASTSLVGTKRVRFERVTVLLITLDDHPAALALAQSLETPLEGLEKLTASMWALPAKHGAGVTTETLQVS